MKRSFYILPHFAISALSLRIPFTVPSCSEDISSTQRGYTGVIDSSSILSSITATTLSSDSYIAEATPAPVYEVITTTLVKTFTVNLTPADPTDAGVTSQTQIADQPATTHTIIVAQEDKSMFTPDHIVATVGEIVRFTFVGGNFTVRQSSLTAPCSPLGGFDSSLPQFRQDSMSNQSYADYTVESTNPEWFYWYVAEIIYNIFTDSARSHQPGSVDHCEAGVVFAVNAGSQFSTFVANSVSQGTSTDNGTWNKIERR